VCVWWLSTIVIVNLYLGILFGQLVVPHRPKSIDTLEELVSQSAIEWAVTQGSAIYELFRKSDRSTVYGRVGERMRNVSTADEGVRRVVHSGWAYIRERSILTFKVSCGLHVVDGRALVGARPPWAPMRNGAERRARLGQTKCKQCLLDSQLFTLTIVHTLYFFANKNNRWLRNTTE